MLAATELGAGFQIAMKDLEIRGAGSVLGAHQSGHIHAVGFDLYTRILGEAVESLRAERESGAQDGEARPALDVSAFGISSAPSQQTGVDLGLPASIPQDYVSDLPTRLDVYRRLGRAGIPGRDRLDGRRAGGPVRPRCPSRYRTCYTSCDSSSWPNRPGSSPYPEMAPASYSASTTKSAAPALLYRSSSAAR